MIKHFFHTDVSSRPELIICLETAYLRPPLWANIESSDINLFIDLISRLDLHGKWLKCLTIQYLFVVVAYAAM